MAPVAPLLPVSQLHQTRPLLLLAICATAYRFSRPDEPTGSRTQRLIRLTEAYDSAISTLILRSTPAHVNLDSIYAILIYAQWMPFAVRSLKDSTESFGNRYNEVSVWSVIGLASRYASIMGLGRCAIQPFQAEGYDITEEDMGRMRIWINLLTCDRNLALTSGFPSALSPAATASVARIFGEHRLARHPDDLRIAALLELSVLANNVMSTKRSGIPIDAEVLQSMDTQMDMWEQCVGMIRDYADGRYCRARLSTAGFAIRPAQCVGPDHLQHCSMPFTSLRVRAHVNFTR